MIVHGLRLRFRTFWGDVLICVLLCVAFLILWHAHQCDLRSGRTESPMSASSPNSH